MNIEIPYAVAAKQLDDGRIIALLPLLFGRLRLTEGRDTDVYTNFW